MKAIYTFFFVLISFSVFAQVGVGTTTPHSSAQLEVRSTTKGFLPPRLTQVQRDAIANPSAGLMVWCTDCGLNGEFSVFNGVTWMTMVSRATVTTVSSTNGTGYGSSVVVTGDITSTGTGDVSTRGVVWSTSSQTPTIALNTKSVESGSFSTGTFTATATGLTSGTTYYIRTYVTNILGTSYGNTITVTAPASISFSPTLLSGLKLWLDATDESSLTLGANRTVGSESYPTVTQWNDKSGNSNHAVLYSNRPGPIYVSSVNSTFVSNSSSYISSLSSFSNIGNNKPAVIVRGRDMSTAETLVSPVTIGNQMSFFCVIRKFADGCTFGTPENNDMSITYSTSYKHWASYANSNNLWDPSTSSIYAEPYKSNPVLCAFYNTTNATSTLVSTLNAGTPSTQVQQANVTYLNKLAFTGRFNGETSSSFICEVLVYNRALTTSEREAIEGYLAWKWGINTLLPNTHTYYAASPQ